MKRKTYIKLIAVATLISILGLANSQALYAQGSERMSLRGKWQFILGDDMRFAQANYDDSDWEKIYVPSTWERQGFHRYDGYAWYRKTFELDLDNTQDQVFLRLGKIDDVDEVYFNGELIGKTGGFPPEHYTAYNIQRTYAIPSNLIRNGKDNVIAVRVYDSQQGGGIVDGDVGIYNYASFYNSVQLAGRWKFRLSDDMEWAKESFDDSEWEGIMVPSQWSSQGFGNYDGFAWYRRTFEFPKDGNISGQMLILGKIDDMDEVYINGVKIGSTGNIESKWADNGEWEKMRNYFIPTNLLKPGKVNTIAVRVYDIKGRGGIYAGPVSIIEAKDYKEFWRDYHKNNYDFPRWIWTYFDEY